MHGQGRRGSADIEDRRRGGAAKAGGGVGLGRLANVPGAWLRGVDRTPPLDQQPLSPAPQGEVGAPGAARAPGGDPLRGMSGPVPPPHGFTHGTSEQRGRVFAAPDRPPDRPGDWRAFGSFSARPL